ncbi:hypothetical protein NCU16998 [Neurospora crassa OR74A]|uniref:Uncharacterized protein n=1 Tax=Neurospora crassa (strain ATCC 24698 / 74-OR23-1A / CBS 708.71 / DSM 1257 / FGSC 987) TaxID=367110 RepID=V5ILD9_NEUCR|nr:hypothetical protein NCU16998 [Neurospora crassa OR74A]ESA42558.1 hypothetical protein NCU16998 [Neurospora crassa OR74A]|eukprot:XP_011394835.1 hypothetical protein NCU16998 [Neurospora crassa OR74A]
MVVSRGAADGLEVGLGCSVAGTWRATRTNGVTTLPTPPPGSGPSLIYYPTSAHLHVTRLLLTPRSFFLCNTSPGNLPGHSTAIRTVCSQPRVLSSSSSSSSI